MAGPSAFSSETKSGLGLPRTTAESDPGLDHSVRIKRDAVDSLLQQPLLREIGMITGTLSTNPNVLSARLAGFDCAADQELHGRIAFLKRGGYQNLSRGPVPT